MNGLKTSRAADEHWQTVSGLGQCSRPRWRRLRRQSVEIPSR